MDRTARINTLLALTLTALFAADRVLKLVAAAYFSIEGFPLIPRVLKFEFFANEGIAFSLPFSGPVLWVVSIGLIGFFSFFAVRYGSKNRHYVIFPYLFFIFGALSNLFDRIFYGHTVDYLIFFGLSAVNLADGMIIAGAAFLILGAGKEKRGRRAPEELPG